MSSSYSSIIVVHSVGGEQMSQTNEENLLPQQQAPLLAWQNTS